MMRKNTKKKKQVKNPKSKSNITKKRAVSKKTKKVLSRNGKQLKNSNKLVKREKNGRILPGGPGLKGAGRPKGSFSGVRSDQLHQAIIAVESMTDKQRKGCRGWLESLIVDSYKDTSLRIALLNKQYPSLKAIEQITISADSMADEEVEEIRKEMKKRFGD